MVSEEGPAEVPASLATSEAEAWERAADEAADALAEQVQDLGERLSRASNAGYRQFWDATRDLNDAIRTAPAIKLDDKLSLQHRVNAMCERARVAQREANAWAEAARQEMEEKLQLADESLRESSTVEDVQQVREDLNLLRNRLNETGDALGRPGRQAVWERWQTLNQLAWQTLNERWDANAAQLSSLLDTVRGEIEAGRPREAREQIKTFQSEASRLECSRQQQRELHMRADSLWKEASALSREKRDRYLAHASRRLDGWRSAIVRQEQLRARLQVDLIEAERRASAATTDVGAALMRGQVDEQRRAIHRLDIEISDLRKKIEETEGALHRS